jgi:hypothetical protein
MHTRLFTDNAGCVFGMKDGYVKNDGYASIFIRSAYLISAYLSSVLHVIHAPRRSSWETTTADNYHANRHLHFWKTKSAADSNTSSHRESCYNGPTTPRTTGTYQKNSFNM